jgi:putative endonuclease
MAFVEQDNRLRPGSTSSLGILGERLAAEHLEANGYRLVMANFTVPIGRNTNQAQVTGEIDIIAFDRDTLCFVEVKTRSSAEFASPLAAVDLRKQRQIIRAARVYRRIFAIRDIAYRYDVVTIVMGPEPLIEVVKGFWNESKFRKRTWSGDIWENA